jgi:SNF2-related domain/Helicase conserved C-terminal domain
MSKLGSKSGRALRTSASTSKYDAHHTVLSKTYGALADLRRELADSKTSIAEREEILRLVAACSDSQRTWLLLEDYFEKLLLSRKDFPGQEEWWSHLMEASGEERLEEIAMLFLRANRSVPTELQPYANLSRFLEIEESKKQQRVLDQLEQWMVPPVPPHLDLPRASLRVVCQVQSVETNPGWHALVVRLLLSRPRSGEKLRPLNEIVELTRRATHEQEQFSPEDWEFIQWLAGISEDHGPETDRIVLEGMDLLQWLAQWGHTPRLELDGQPLGFEGQIATLTPHLENGKSQLALRHLLALPGGKSRPVHSVRFFSGLPCLALVEQGFYLVRNPPPRPLLRFWAENPAIPVNNLSHRLRTHLRRSQVGGQVNWEDICLTHQAVPQFVFELSADTVRLRLLARSERDKSLWHWTGQEWQRENGAPAAQASEKPEVLEDARLDAAVQWLRRLDWFTPEPGLWVGDANEIFLSTLAAAWPEKPKEADYLGNQAFQRLFLAPRHLRPNLKIKGSGIDWFTVSADWEAEGLKLTEADLERLKSATEPFVKLPDAGWVQLDTKAVELAHETMADLGLDNLSVIEQKVGLEQAAHLNEDAFNRFGKDGKVKALREKLANFKGIPEMAIPGSVQARMRPYQKEGFEFLCHLTGMRLGGILADDMGLGKTLQALSWLAWMKENQGRSFKPALVICPASVLHNWRREAEKFTPKMKVLVLESGAARHNLRKKIPQYDLIVTNYALLRRDLEALQKFSFGVVVLDEAQFIKNPDAQVTQSVKQLKSSQRLALTGTPLENRLLDLWSITDFIQPDYLGSQDHFVQTYDVKGDNDEAATAARIARRRLAAKLRPLMLRRLKKQVAQDLPDRIEERRDCQLGDEQRKLYLAELRRSREQVMKAVQEKGLNKSKMHVLAALTRLRQICCHPFLVGNDSASGKTETLFELLEPLLAEGQKVLLFSQFVQMLKLLQTDCQKLQIPTYILTGETKERQTVVQAFQDEPNASVFLLSLRAAGTGLNLTNASYVILYDPWWNPAVEAQAIDRSHRIGQTRTVNAYRLIAPGTVEEKIWDLQQRKAQTIADVLGEEGFARNLSQSDLDYLFSED